MAQDMRRRARYCATGRRKRRPSTRSPGAPPCATKRSFANGADGEVRLGDTVDLAFLVLAEKLGLDHQALRRSRPLCGRIPYEPQQRFAAAFTPAADETGQAVAHVKGAAEFILPRCRNLDQQSALAAADDLAAKGFRVLAVARGRVPLTGARDGNPDALDGLELLGIAGLIDPVRPEVPQAIEACRGSGISVRMVTGDHPRTALAIADQLGLAHSLEAVVTGRELQAVEQDPAAFDRLVSEALVFARVEPTQKLAIVDSLQRNGEVVAVTGDGVNDAPALSAAAIGVAMGRGGTDVARGAADLILADDNFASIVGGIEEGRIAYDNVRKLIYLLIPTGLGEIVLFFLAILFALPMPLFAVQLLWLNLVTNGIQHVALAFEKSEPGILKRGPRPPGQPLFDRRMLGQVLLAGSTMGVVCFVFYFWCLEGGMAETQARNLVLLLMVMLENVQALNARSELRFRLPRAPVGQLVPDRRHPGRPRPAYRGHVHAGPCRAAGYRPDPPGGLAAGRDPGGRAGAGDGDLQASDDAGPKRLRPAPPNLGTGPQYGATVLGLSATSAPAPSCAPSCAGSRRRAPAP